MTVNWAWIISSIFHQKSNFNQSIFFFFFPVINTLLPQIQKLYQKPFQSWLPTIPQHAYLLEHLATFTVNKESGIMYPADGMRKLLQLEKTQGIWSQKMQLCLDRQWVLIMDYETGVRTHFLMVFEEFFE